jgi:hypothetical protein
MKPIYFPFTWIPESIQRVLFACFDQAVIYSPHSELVPEAHRDLEAGGRLEIRLLREEPGDDLPKLLASYHAWAELHQGEHPDFHKFRSVYEPPPRDPSSYEIRSQILNPDPDGEPRTKKAANPLLMARLFLAIAQQYDQQQASLSEDLHRISGMQQDLLRQMCPERGEIPSATLEMPSPESAEKHRPMAAERLAAWRVLYAHHRRQTEINGPTPPDSPHVLITADRDVPDLLMGTGVETAIVCRISNLPRPGEGTALENKAGREKINRILHSAGAGHPLSGTRDILLSENPGRPNNSAALTIYRMAGDIATARFPGHPGLSTPLENTQGDKDVRHTLLGCITGELDA